MDGSDPHSPLRSSLRRRSSGLDLALPRPRHSSSHGNPRRLPRNLRKHIRATEAELKRLALGEVLTRTLEAPDGREITTFGVIKVRCTADTFVARLKDIERFKASEYVLQIGRFQPQPSVQDVRPLAFDADERAALRAPAGRARARSACPQPPSNVSIGRSRGAHRPNPDRRRIAAAVPRGRSPDVSVGRERGPSGLRRPDRHQSASRRFPDAAAPRRLSCRVAAGNVRLAGRVSSGAPRRRGPFLWYWSREKFGLKPVVSITHAVLMRREGAVAFGAKQVYASHYFESSLGLSVFISTPGTDDQVT